MVAEEDNELQIKGFELGAVDCIAKSASDHAVSVRVRNALRHKQREDELQRLCQIDVDTGFWNQAHFDLRLHEHLSAFLRYQRGSCLLLLEVDVRAEAEEIMPWSEITRLIAQVIRGLCRDCDVLSHWQQGRFALILPGTYESGALLLAERLRAEVVLAIGEHQSKSTVLPSIAVLSTEILTERQWVTLSHCRQATEQVLQRVSLAGGNAIATVGREELLRVGAALSGSEQEQMVAEQQQQDACQLSDFHTIMPLVIERVEFEELMAFLVRQVQSLLSIKAVWVALLGNRQDGLDCHYATDAYQPILARSLAMNNAFLSAVTAQHEVTDWRGSWFDNHQLYHELAVPLYTGSQFIGVLGVGLTDSERCFSDQDKNILQYVSESTGATTDYLRLVVQKEQEIQSRQKLEDDLESARRAAEEANQAKSTFLANMSHELRTPLNAIIGYAEILEEECEDRIGMDDLLPDLEKISSSGKHLLEMINQVLDLSKIESGRSQLYLEKFYMADFLKDVVNTISPLMKKNGNELRLDERQLPEYLYTDRVKLKQVLLNLLSNAAKFTKNGQVWLVMEPAENTQNAEKWLTWVVRDTGVGITAEQAKSLFAPFTQADVSTTREFGGTGLGLAISRSFCAMMGGSIEINDGWTEGAEFRVNLPCRMELSWMDMLTEDKIDTAAEEYVVVAMTRDNALTHMLSEVSSMRVSVRQTPAELMTVLQQNMPDLLVIEHAMSEENDGLYHLLHQHYPSLNIVVLLAATEVDQFLIAQPLVGTDDGFLDYIVQPVEVLELQARLYSSLRSQRYIRLLEERAQIDLVTNLWNTQHFVMRLDVELSSVLRYQRPCSLLKLSLDNFTEIRALLTPQQCHRVLMKVGAIIRTTVRHCDVPCRYQDNDFVIILPETGQQQVLPFIQRLLQQLVPLLNTLLLQDFHIDKALEVHLGAVVLVHNIKELTTPVVMEAIDLSLSKSREAYGCGYYIETL
jgi:diguanylate cyclase (GGDEF)-like protein